jgi:hypothetical protein
MDIGGYCLHLQREGSGAPAVITAIRGLIAAS